MPFRERQALIQLGISLMVLGFYASMLLGGPRLDTVNPTITFGLTFAFIGFMFLAERDKQPEDERDRLIRQRSYSLSAAIAYVGSIVLVAASDGLIAPAPVNSALLMCLVFGAAAIGSMTKLYLYRRI